MLRPNKLNEYVEFSGEPFYFPNMEHFSKSSFKNSILYFVRKLDLRFVLSKKFATHYKIRKQ